MISKSEIKFLKSLNLLKFREKHKMFKVEGWRSIKEFIDSNYKMVGIYQSSDEICATLTHMKYKKIRKSDLKVISSFKNPNNVVAVFKIKNSKININTLKKEIGIYLEDVNIPGNLGSIIRTCDWFGINNVICSNESVDVFNPKVVQASMGSLSRISVSYVNTEKFLYEIKKNNINSYTADLDGKSIYDYPKLDNGIIFFGNEARGISNKIKDQVLNKISIPKNNTKCESLNLSVSLGVIISQIFRR